MVLDAIVLLVVQILIPVPGSLQSYLVQQAYDWQFSESKRYIMFKE